MLQEISPGARHGERRSPAVPEEHEAPGTHCVYLVSLAGKAPFGFKLPIAA